jgi:hypothetical protein
MCRKSLQPPFPCRRAVGAAAGRATVLVLVWGLITGPLLAQDSNTPTQPPKGGLQIRSVSAYAVYYSSFLPNGGAGVQPGAAKLPDDVGAGGSFEFDWTKFTERSNFSLSYTPSYTAYVRNSSLNALNHALSLNTSRKLAPRWTLGFAAAGDLSSLEQSLFSPTTLGSASSAPSTFNDLAAGLLTGKFANNPQLGAILTGSPLVESPVRNLLYGQRMFTSSASVSLSHSYSPRLSVSVSGGGGHTQHVSENQVQGAAGTSTIPNTTTANASVAISYSLSPLTQLGGSVNSTRTSSSLFDSYTTNTLATLGRTLAGRWILQLHGGVGVTTAVHQTSLAVPTQPAPVVGGSVAYKTFSHTFLGSYDRAVSDSYGVGASTTSSAGGGWHWGRPGSGWWLDSSFNWQRLEGKGTILANTSGWHATFGVNRAIGTHIILLTQYTHLTYSGGLQAVATHLSQEAVRVSAVYTPHAAVLR